MTKQTTPFGVFRVGCGRQTVMHLPSRRLVDASLKRSTPNLQLSTSWPADYPISCPNSRHLLATQYLSR